MSRAWQETWYNIINLPKVVAVAFSVAVVTVVVAAVVAVPIEAETAV